jgi:hypothetical protein
MLGIIANYIIKHIAQKNILKKITIFTFILVIGLLTISNLHIYSKTYNLNNYKASASAYGGISLGELESMCLGMKTALKSNSSDLTTAHLESFEFRRSLNYVCNKYNLKLNYFSQDEIINDNLFFIITENKNTSKNIKKYTSRTQLKNSQKIGRFTLLTFSNK